MASDNRCELIIQRERFSEELSKQIAQGKLLQDIKILSAPANFRGWENVIGDPYKEQKERLSQQYTIWNDYNKELLRRSFNDPDNDYFETYSNAGNLRLLERSDYFTLVQKIISDEITVLESLLNKIDLIPCSAIASSNNIKETEVDSKKVFVVYGHDRLMKLEVENFLRSKLKLDVVALDEKPNGNRTIIEKFEHYSKDCAFAIVLMSPDDNAEVDGQIFKRARQNVVLELGYFMAKLDREKVCVLVRGDIEKPSDISGILTLSYDGDWKFELLDELKHAGVEV
jgi:predicted nucleotide-binding protein